MYYFNKESGEEFFRDEMLSDFSDSRFQDTFRAYFMELGIPVKSPAVSVVKILV